MKVKDAIEYLNNIDKDLDLTVYIYDDEYGSILKPITYMSIGYYKENKYTSDILDPQLSGKQCVTINI